MQKGTDKQNHSFVNLCTTRNKENHSHYENHCKEVQEEMKKRITSLVSQQVKIPQLPKWTNIPWQQMVHSQGTSMQKSQYVPRYIRFFVNDQ